MGTIQQMLDQVRRLNIRAESMQAIRETSDMVVELNREQLQEGKDRFNILVFPDYASEAYARYKQTLNSKPPQGTPDLRLTGAFYRGFFVALTVNSIEVSSRDGKTNKLEQKYSGRIFGLSPESIRKYSTGVLYRNIQMRITRVTRLRFR